MWWPISSREESGDARYKLNVISFVPLPISPESFSLVRQSDSRVLNRIVNQVPVNISSSYFPSPAFPAAFWNQSLLVRFLCI